MEKVKEYALLKYPSHFKKAKVMVVNGKKKTTYYDVEPIVKESETCYFIYNNKDASPIILSKTPFL